MYKKGIIVVCLLFSGLFLSGCSLNQKQAALQINTAPTANVFIDGKLLGKTPYNSSELKAGEVTIKLIPESTTEAFTSWEGKIKLTGGVLTLIDRELAASEINASGQILSLEKSKDKNAALISIVTEPDGVLVKIDGETKGFSPLNIESIPAGDHEIILSKDGYSDKSLRVKNVLAYRLIVNAKLGQTQSVQEPVITLSPSPAPAGKGTPVPTTVVKTTPGASTPGPEPAKPYVLIKETPTNFLRVRNSPPSGVELAQVKPGEKFPLLEEKVLPDESVWYKITYTQGKEGWVSGQYAEKVE